MTDARTLVIENDPDDGPGVLGEWLTAAGLELEVVRPHRGEKVPAAEGGLEGHVALVVLGGADHGPWVGELELLLADAVRRRLPTLALCLGAQQLARATGGRVGPAEAGPEVGPGLVAKRDAAYADPLFGPVPMMPDVMQWHHDEVTVLPPGATLLAASPRYPHQAFRCGDRAWGLQFHVECDLEMLTRWAADSDGMLAEVGVPAEEMLARCAAALPDIAEVWRPVAERFAELALGRLEGLDHRTSLPLLEP